MAWTKEQAREYGKKWYHANRAEQLARAKERHKKNPEARSRSWRTTHYKSYGITLADYDRMWKSQHGRCKICNVEEWAASRGVLCVDHDHSTGVIRGLLCDNCNQLLGRALDNSNILREAAAYLEKSQ